MTDRQKIDLDVLEYTLQSTINKLEYARPLSDEDKEELILRKQRTEAEIEHFQNSIIENSLLTTP